jgi:hypothetical protein
MHHGIIDQLCYFENRHLVKFVETADTPMFLWVPGAITMAALHPFGKAGYTWWYNLLIATHILIVVKVVGRVSTARRSIVVIRPVTVVPAVTTWISTNALTVICQGLLSILR